MWLEANYAFGQRDEAQTRLRFEEARGTANPDVAERGDDAA